MRKFARENRVRYSVRLSYSCGLLHHLLSVSSHDSSSRNSVDNGKETLYRRLHIELAFMFSHRTARERRIFVERIHVIISSRFEIAREEGKREREIPLPLG